MNQGSIKINTRQRKIKTQNEIIFSDHLQIKLEQQFKSKLYKNEQFSFSTDKIVRQQLETNFNIKVTNQFVFILLHLRNISNRNPINIQIPDICVFNDRSPYDIIYSSEGYIKSYKVGGGEDRKIPLKDVYNFFKSKWKSSLKLQHSMACLRINNIKSNQNKTKKLQKDYLMLSDIDCSILCLKSKKDPIFTQLQYIQNKIQAQSSLPIKVDYLAQVDIQLIKLATQSLLSNKKQSQIAESLTQQQYLCYCNQKISQILNYQHNIRLIKAQFYYIKKTHRKYILVNIKNIQFSNLTKALRQREKKLKKLEEQKNKIIELTPRRYERYKRFQTESVQKIRQYQDVMAERFEKTIKTFNINSIQQNKKQQIRNESAYKKLHPQSKISFNELILSNNFQRLKKSFVKSYNKRSFTKPSKYVTSFYNKVDQKINNYI